MTTVPRQRDRVIDILEAEAQPRVEAVEWFLRAICNVVFGAALALVGPRRRRIGRKAGSPRIPPRTDTTATVTEPLPAAKPDHCRR